jgi:hypothetical protein
MSLVPLNVPEDRKSKYEQLFAISHLKINVHLFLRPGQLDEIDAIEVLYVSPVVKKGCSTVPSLTSQDFLLLQRRYWHYHLSLTFL